MHAGDSNETDYSGKAPGVWESTLLTLMMSQESRIDGRRWDGKLGGSFIKIAATPLVK
jgi:hypothetical protein